MHSIHIKNKCCATPILSQLNLKLVKSVLQGGGYGLKKKWWSKISWHIPFKVKVCFSSWSSPEMSASIWDYFNFNAYIYSQKRVYKIVIHLNILLCNNTARMLLNCIHNSKNLNNHLQTKSWKWGINNNELFKEFKICFNIPVMQ